MTKPPDLMQRANVQLHCRTNKIPKLLSEEKDVCKMVSERAWQWHQWLSMADNVSKSARSTMKASGCLHWNIGVVKRKRGEKYDRWPNGWDAIKCLFCPVIKVHLSDIGIWIRSLKAQEPINCRWVNNLVHRLSIVRPSLFSLTLFHRVANSSVLTSTSWTMSTFTSSKTASRETSQRNE